MKTMKVLMRSFLLVIVMLVLAPTMLFSQQKVAGRTVVSGIWKGKTVKYTAGEEGIKLSNIKGRELSKSTNTENGWLQIFNGKENFYAHDIKISPSDPSIIYAAGNGVYRSTNSGVSWDSIGENSFLLIGVDPLNSDIVLAISSTPVLINIYRTTNGGKKWDYLIYYNPTYISFFIFDRSEPEAVYSALTQGKLNISFDYGTTWENVNLPNHPGGTFIYSMAIPNDDPNLLYISAKYGVYKSTDRGNTWDSLNISTTENYNKLFIDPANSQTVYVTIRNEGVFKSTDGGEVWIEKNKGLNNLNFSSYVSLVINPKNTEEIYLAADSLLYQSTDGGDNWSLIKPSPPIHEIRAIALDTSSGTRILIGGSIPGIYELDLITSVKEDQNQSLPSTIELSQNYPNPFNPSTVISYQLPIASYTKLMVYDMLGRKILERNLGIKHTGIHEVTLSMSEFASGIYFYRIEAITTDGKRYTSTKKMELLK